MKKFDIYDRCEDFSVAVIHLIEAIPYGKSVGIIGDQIVRSSTSVGANLCEADNARSKKEFLSCLGISLKETGETLYWFKLLKRITSSFESEISKLENDCLVIKKILGKIYQNTRT